MRFIQGFAMVCILMVLTFARHAAAHSAWVEQAADVRPTAYVSQAPTHLRRSLVASAATPTRTRQVRRATPVRQQPPPSGRQEAILDFGEVLDTSRLPSVREGVRLSGPQR